MYNGSEDHMELMYQVSKATGAKECTKNRGKYDTTGFRYIPDLFKRGLDIECELVPKEVWINRKAMKWDKKRKKLLVLGVPQKVLKNFNEVWVWDLNRNERVAKLK